VRPPVTPVIRPHLSISSSRTTGFIEPASRMARTMRPAARRRRYAGDRGSPPRPGRRRATPGRTYGPWPGHRLAERRLTDAGRAHQREDGAAAATADHAQAAVGPALAHGQYSTMRSLTSSRPVCPRPGSAGLRRCRRRPRCGRSTGCRARCPARSGSSDLGRLLGGALQLRDFLIAALCTSSAGWPLDPGPVVVLLGGGVTGQVASSLRTAASCCRSRNSFCCFSMPSWTSLRIDSATFSSAMCSLVQPMTSSSRSTRSWSPGSAASARVQVGR